MKIVYVCLLRYIITSVVVHLLLSIIIIIIIVAAAIEYSLLYTNSMSYDNCHDDLRWAFNILDLHKWQFSLAIKIENMTVCIWGGSRDI